MATANTKRNKDAEVNDLYTTPIEALELLWENAPYVLKRCTTVVDNSFGLGDITRFFREKGKTTVGFDINDYGCSGDEADMVIFEDFLQTGYDPFPMSTVMVFNPPFTLTYEFVNKSLELCDNLFMFNRLNTLESLKRADKFKSKEWPLKKVYVFSRRVSCPKGVDYEPSPNATAYAWFQFEKGYEGEPTITWI